jgi:hypothetical protein
MSDRFRDDCGYVPLCSGLWEIVGYRVFSLFDDEPAYLGVLKTELWGIENACMWPGDEELFEAYAD